jgi:hypothetical protein
VFVLFIEAKNRFRCDCHKEKKLWLSHTPYRTLKMVFCMELKMAQKPKKNSKRRRYREENEREVGELLHQAAEDVHCKLGGEISVVGADIAGDLPRGRARKNLSKHIAPSVRLQERNGGIRRGGRKAGRVEGERRGNKQGQTLA